MSSGATKEQGSYRIPDDTTWASAWKMSAVLAVIGIIASGVGWAADAHRFLFSYLFAFATFLTLGLGALLFVLIYNVSAASWVITTRRIAECMLPTLPVLFVLSLPILANAGQIYAWAHAEAGHGSSSGHASAAEGSGESLLGASVAHAQGHGGHGGGEGQAATGGHRAPAAAHGSGHGQVGTGGPPFYRNLGEMAQTRMEAHAHHGLIQHKSPYLNVPFWVGRAVIYFAVWTLLGLAYYRWSIKQDETRDPKLTVKMQYWAPLATVILALTLTFAAFDWLMSLQPAWYSTIYGVYLFAGAAVGIHALVILVTLSLRSHGHLGNAVNEEHYHDLGKLMFGFMCFWAYAGFSQWMLIWYAALPEEVTYYHLRSDGGWMTVSLLLILGHFAVPFVYLISRGTKRRLAMLAVGAAWLLFMHVVDIYWFVMPYASDTFQLHWLDVACLLAVGGVFMAVVFYTMRRHPLVPVGDPRLSRALHFVQTQ